jgi:hypothetical protein
VGAWKCNPGETCSADEVYKDGTPVVVGDHVSTPRYPRGSLSGVVCKSDSFKCSGCGKPANRVKADDGTIFSFSSSKARKLRVKT